MQELAVHRGSCHCGRVSFEMTAPRRLIMWDCNCSICLLKRNTHIVVPRARFRLIAGEEFLSEYRFNTRVARSVAAPAESPPGSATLPVKGYSATDTCWRGWKAKRQ